MHRRDLYGHKPLVHKRFVICATALQATGGGAEPQPLDAATEPDAYAIYATLLPRLWAQEKGILLLQQETDPMVAYPAFFARQREDWSVVGFNRDRTKAIVHVHLRLHGWVVKFELKDGTWQSVGESCNWNA